MGVFWQFSPEKHWAHAWYITNFKYVVYNLMNKNLSINRTWADLRSILPKVKYEGKLFSFFLSQSGN